MTTRQYFDHLEAIKSFNKKVVSSVEETRRTPELIFDPSKGDFLFKGCSMPENVDAFYSPILKYFDQYITIPANQTRLIFNLEYINSSSSHQTRLIFNLKYINSSSSQMLLAILYKMKQLKENGYDLKVEWHYMQDDDDILEAGKTISELSGISFEYKEHSS